MAQKPNITKLYDKIFSVKEMLTEVVNTAMEAANDAEAFGGEVSRVITGQLRQSLLPGIQKLVDDESNPASMMSMIKFLDSVPLAWVRQGPEQEPGMSTGSDMINPIAQPGMEGNMAVGPDGAPAQQGAAPVNPTAPTEPIMQQESAILKGKSSTLRSHLKEDWKANHEEAPIEEGKLDFRNFKEGFKRDIVPSQLEADSADKIYNKVLEGSAKPKATERLDEDILGGAFNKVEANTFGDWRNLMDDTDEKIENSLRG